MAGCVVVDPGTDTTTTTATSTSTSTTTTTTETTGDGDGEPPEGPIIDLSVEALIDVNETSATFDQPVHPNDYAGMVSAWYFGHAT